MAAKVTIFVAGGDTVIGAALLRRIRDDNGWAIVGAGNEHPPLNDAFAVSDFFERVKPRHVIYAGGRSGGIAANMKYPAELIVDNLKSVTNVATAAHRFKAEKLLYLASSCVYPKHAPQPMAIESLHTGPFEPTNQAYATAKLAGIVMCQAFRQQYGDAFITAIPTNTLGPDDHFDVENAHVAGALLVRMHGARAAGADRVVIWGTGAARREFVYADDIADGCLFLLRHYHGERPVNIAGGEDVTIAELSRFAAETVGYTGRLEFDASRPDGMPLKALDAAPIAALGWKPRTTLREALKLTYAGFLRKSRSAQ